MKNSLTTTAAAPSVPRAAEARLPWLARPVLARLARVRQGTLVVHAAGGRFVYGDDDTSFPAAVINVRDARFFGAIALRGSIGAGEAYARSWWTSDDPTAVVRLFARNRDVLEGVEGGFARLSKPILAAYHALRRNTRAGSRANIRAHYDLSNEFFGLWLDETMTYSCGLFERPDSTLREASEAKIDRLCRKLDLTPDDHLLEIGTGWGAFSIHAAREYGCRITTTTISDEQHALAAERIRSAGLTERVTLLKRDYRALEGRFDKLVSVEMIEAVGHHYFEEFFRCCAQLLQPDGRMALQAITIEDRNYDSARRSVDFIQRHIFPGSCIPSVTALCSAMTRGGDLRLVHLEDIGHHYVPTLSAWRANLRARWDDALALGYDETFLRLWEFYFVYCEGGFAERAIGDVQMILDRSGTRSEPPLAVL